MGTVCCRREAVKVFENPSEIIERKKRTLFINDEYESSFIEFSTPRSGKAIRWRKGQLIGQGAFAQVFQCLNMETGELLAVKHFTLSDDPNRIQKEFTNMKKEVSVLKTLEHPNIVHYYQTDLSPDMSGISILLEFVPGGSLKSLLLKYNSLEEDVIEKYARQLLKGLSYLHEHGIVHRDLKSGNVLITPEGRVKLTDFGSSRRFEHLDDKLSKSLKGSPYWMAPEVVTRLGHSFPADVWSFGCLLIEMFNGSPPWSDQTRDAYKVLQLIATPNLLPAIPNWCSNELNELITACIKRDPALRPTVDALMNFRFFTKYKE